MATKLSNFTDVLGDVDEMCDSQISQPLSFSPTIACQSQDTKECSQNKKSLRPPKGTGQYKELRSVEEIDPKYRDVFTYPFFNIVQSRVIEDALYSDKSMVVCAPTGSGKTVVFEMAIVQLLMEIEDKNYSNDYKIIYMAPVKALCTERLTEWYSKFTKLGLLCIEVTGDTDVDFTQLQAYRVIITTPEKWDMLTRRWRDHRGLVEMIKLFLIDEVHILNDETRGPVLEAVVSRMKTIQASAQSAHRIEKLQKQYQNINENGVIELLGTDDDSPPRIRFVAVSATVSNPEDVAAWLGTDDKPAVYYKFGDECRPVKLRRVVEGYSCADGTSIFKFDIILNYKLWPIIQKYHDGKPTLIFCNTRKSVLLTAETLSREITITFNPAQQAKLTALASTIKNKKLQSLVLVGVACHHAGMLYEERTYIEQAFRNGDLPILVTTTTLAMGVNLPAHLVIIKNTQQYVNGAYQEYSISTVLQMVGRAGRPQFDTDATAVIMTRQKDKARYQALAGGSEPLQSYLHKRLAENLNSEAALRTVGDVAQCVEWLRSTFLYVRAAKDPKRYLGLIAAAPEHLILRKIEELCVIAMNGLASAGLITMDEASCILSTEAGRLMSLYYLDLETMKHIMKIQGNESLERLVWLICESHELSDMHLRTDERRCLNALNRNNTAATIRFPLKGKITTRQMKLSCIIQAILGCLPIPDPSLYQEAMKIMRIADRICKCLVAYVSRPEQICQQLQYYAAIFNSIILAKCITAHLWENSPYVSKQLKGIGPSFSTLLATAGKVNFMLLEESHPRDLERIMNKGAPAGNILRKQISLLPKYQLTTAPVDENTVSVKLSLLNQAFLSENLEQLTAGATHKCYVIVGDSENHILMLRTFTDKDLISVYDGSIYYKITRMHNFEHQIFVHCVSSSFAGVDVHCEYKFTNSIPATPFTVDGLSYNTSIKRNPNNKQPTIQSTLTGIQNDRKRKKCNEEITHSKEKKKRDNAFAEKVKLLKESFGRTSNSLKKDFMKAQNVSKDMLTDLIPPGKSANVETSTKISKETNKFNPDVGFSNDNLDDFMDDSRIDSILNDIESEIIKLNKKDPLEEINLKQSNTHMNKLFHTSNIKTDNASKAQYLQNPQTSIRKKPSNTFKNRSNYNFLELLEKNLDLSDEDVTPEKDSGFSETIKTHIDKFILNSHQTFNFSDFELKELCEKDQSCDTIINDGNGDSKDETRIVQNTSEQTDKMEEDYINKTKHKDNYIDNNNHTILTNNDDSMTDFPLKRKENISAVKPEDECLKSDRIINLNVENIYNPANNKFCDKKVKELVKTNILELEAQYKINDFPHAHFHDIKKKFKNYKLQTEDLETSSLPTNYESSVAVEHLPSPSMNQELFNKTVTRDVRTELSVEELPLVLSNNLSMLPACNKELQKFNTTEVVEPQSQELPLASVSTNKTSSLLSVKFPLTETPGNLSANTQFENFAEIEKKYSFTKETNLNSPGVITAPSITNILNLCANRKELRVDTRHSYNDPCINSKIHEWTNVSEINNSNGKKEYEKKYSFSAEEVDIHTKITNEHEIRVIRRLKIDLDVCKIISNSECKDSSNHSRQEQSFTETNDTKKSGIINGFKEKETDNYHDDQFKTSKILLRKATLSEIENSVLPEKDKDSLKTEMCYDKTTNSEKNQLANILRKYSKIIGNSKNCNAKVSKNLSSPVKNIKQKKTSTTFKPNRPFKISEIEHVISQQPLQCEDVKTTPNVEIPIYEVPETIQDPLNVCINRVSNETIKYEENYSEDMSQEYLEQYELPSQLLEHKLEVFKNNFEIDQSMFNPKTLLQSLRNKDDDDEIIPPPPEFGNDTIISSYSPETSDNYTDDLMTNMNYFEQTQSLIPEKRQSDSSIFENNSLDVDLSPSKEIETWTLTRDDAFQNDLSKTTPMHCYTVMHKNKIFQNNLGEPFNTNNFSKRQGKLSVFKFNRKSKLKF